MKNYIYITIIFGVFQACKAQSKIKTDFIYHTADYNLGIIQEERLYDSSTGVYEYKKYSNKNLVKNIKLYLRFPKEELDTIYKLYISSESEMIDCYFEDNVIVHKSIITYNSQKDNFNQIECTKNRTNPIFAEAENKIESYITSSSTYKTTFYWESYEK